MNGINSKNSDFINIYSKCHRLATAVFVVSNVIDRDDDLKNKIKNLSLNLISASVNLKDTNVFDAEKTIKDIEKKSIELMSVINIASLSDLISKMNGNILKEEFQSFISELNLLSEKLRNSKNDSIRSVFEIPITVGFNNVKKTENVDYQNEMNETGKNESVKISNLMRTNNGHKRKDLRKSMILDYIKGHNNVSIKDIVPNITGCSEKTVQRELISLINEGKIKKEGERRWSKYSII